MLQTSPDSCQQHQAHCPALPTKTNPFGAVQKHSSLPAIGACTVAREPTFLGRRVGAALLRVAARRATRCLAAHACSAVMPVVSTSSSCCSSACCSSASSCTAFFARCAAQEQCSQASAEGLRPLWHTSRDAQLIRSNAVWDQKKGHVHYGPL